MDRGNGDGVPHELQFAREFGRSPGNGVTAMPMSRDPLATEGEATPGPDDVNPYDEREFQRATATMDDDPTDGDDPYAFDDIAEGVSEVRLPTVDAPRPSADLEVDIGVDLGGGGGGGDELDFGGW